MHLYTALLLGALRLHLYLSPFSSNGTVVAYPSPRGRSSRLSRAVSYLAFNMPTSILSFPHLGAFGLFVYRRCETRTRRVKVARSFARRRGNDFPEKSRFALVRVPHPASRPSRFFFVFLSFFFPVESPAKCPRGRREREVHDLRTDRIKWGNLARATDTREKI